MVEKTKSIQEALAEVQRNSEIKRVQKIMNEWENINEAGKITKAVTAAGPVISSIASATKKGTKAKAGPRPCTESNNV